MTSVIVTGKTAAYMDAIVAGTIVSAYVDPTTKHLILVRQDDTLVDAGDVEGPIGPAGSGSIICTSTTRPTLGSGAAGTVIYETDTKYEHVWEGTVWRGRPKGLLGKFKRTSVAQAVGGAWATAGTVDFTIYGQRVIKVASYIHSQQVTADAAGLTQAQLSIVGQDFVRFMATYNAQTNQERYDHTDFEQDLPSGTYQAKLEIMSSSAGAFRALSGTWLSVSDEGTFT